MRIWSDRTLHSGKKSKFRGYGTDSDLLLQVEDFSAGGEGFLY